MTDNITTSIDLPCAPGDAMGLFINRFTHWWPSEYSWSQEALDWIGIDVETGLCSELGPGGFRCDWGSVLAREPGKRLVLAWQISPRREPVPDAEKAGKVEFLFEPVGDNDAAPGASRLTLTHYDFDLYGDEGADYAAAMGSDQGWPYILSKFKAFVEGL